MSDRCVLQRIMSNVAYSYVKSQKASFFGPFESRFWADLLNLQYICQKSLSVTGIDHQKYCRWYLTIL